MAMVLVRISNLRRYLLLLLFNKSLPVLTSDVVILPPELSRPLAKGQPLVIALPISPKSPYVLHLPTLFLIQFDWTPPLKSSTIQVLRIYLPLFLWTLMLLLSLIEIHFWLLTVPVFRSSGSPCSAL